MCWEVGRGGGGEEGGGGVGGVDHSQPLFYFVPQDSHSQTGSTRGGGERELWRIWIES